MTKTNKYLGRVYEAKCGCKQVVKDIFVKVGDLELNDSKMLVDIKIIHFCDEGHLENFDKDRFSIDLSHFDGLIRTSYGTPTWSLDTAETMKYRRKYLESKDENKVDTSDE